MVFFIEDSGEEFFPKVNFDQRAEAADSVLYPSPKNVFEGNQKGHHDGQEGDQVFGIAQKGESRHFSEFHKGNALNHALRIHKA